MNEQNQTITETQAKKKKLTQKWWFWVIVIVCGVIMISMFLSDDLSGDSLDGEETTATSNPAQSSEPVTQIDEATYKSQCELISYFNLSHYPDRYVNQDIKYRGKVRQVIEQGNDLTLLVDVTRDEYGFYDNTVYVTYTRKSTDPRILEDDMITMYGSFQGLTTYTTVMGEAVTVPSLDAYFIVLG